MLQDRYRLVTPYYASREIVERHGACRAYVRALIPRHFRVSVFRNADAGNFFRHGRFVRT